MDRPLTVPALRARKQPLQKGDTPCDKIVALTAYDFTFASLLDQAGVDVILVGDSLGMVVQGNSTTLPVTLDEMVYHTKSVARGVKRALLVADMPFLSYQSDLSTAILSAGRLLKEGSASAVKIEGGVHIAETIERLVHLDIPVMGHVGMTPQSVHRMGGFKVQGRGHRSSKAKKDSQGTWEQILDDAKAVAEAGAFAIVVESVPRELGREITRRVDVPTIGIGAGEDCDGQILVSYDMLGLTGGTLPSFVEEFARLREGVSEAVRSYAADVRKGAFPTIRHSFSIKKTAVRLRSV